MKTKLLNNKGYSLVEIIIVLGMIGILLGASFGMFSYISSINTKKTVTNISSCLKKTQVATMSKGRNFVTYIYKLSDGYYMITDDSATPTLDATGTKIAGASVDMYAVDSTGTSVLVNGTNVVDGTNAYIKIAYNKSGAFNTNITKIDSIKVSGSRDYTITLGMDTGKHVVE